MHIIDGKRYDFIFSCPPYADLEVYSDDPNDISNMEYDDFAKVYSSIINKGCQCLSDNSFAAIVLSDIRDKHGFYRDFIGLTKQAFKDAGLRLYNDVMMLQILGTAMLRANKTFANRKLTKVHENVLIFYKGDPKKIRERFKMDQEDDAE
jgi:hypothetical protein